MPKLAIPLTDIQVRTAKPKDKAHKLADGGGMYLLVNTDGTKYWRLDYRLNDKRNTLAFGKYPETTLTQARDQRKATRELLEAGTFDSIEIVTENTEYL
ncbi:Arm DNA-binding domain-containing protein [Undibacterium sp. Ren11W]